jgi:hypothetical protein
VLTRDIVTADGDRTAGEVSGAGAHEDT